MSTLITSHSSNGATAAPLLETCIQRIARETGNYHQEFWLDALLYCHVPPHGEADAWRDGIERVKACADRLIRKEA